MIVHGREGDVHILRMDHGENRFDADFIEAINTALDVVEAAAGPKALVTVGSGKFYSNGLDLDYMMSGGVDPNDYLKKVLGVMGRILVFPCATVAAMNGHAFGAGAQLALAHDYRVMRVDRGYFCMPEVDMKVALHPGMTAIIMARLPHQSAHEVIATGTRYGAAAALERRIVDEACDEDLVVARAVERVAPLVGKADEVMRTLKRGMYPGVLEALSADLTG